MDLSVKKHPSPGPHMPFKLTATWRPPRPEEGAASAPRTWQGFQALPARAGAWPRPGAPTAAAELGFAGSQRTH